MISNEPTTPPEPDELEVSLFGPGFGECVVAHAGWGDWIIVDSCMGQDGSTPAGLAYLNQLGIDTAQQVRRVVATHWHNDHVRGLAETVAECASAKFVCSQALWSRDFVALTDLWKKQGLAASPVTELSEVLDRLAKSGSLLRGGSGYFPLVFAVANRRLWSRPSTGDVSFDTSAELHSLSPSDAAIKKSLDMIATLSLPGQILVRPASSRPNQFSVVLWLRVGGVCLLLGADMEERDNPYGGWSLIVESAERPQGAGSLFKIPHHGSKTGECDDVWTKMLEKNPIALLTPFQHGRTRLPTKEQADWICARTSNAFITAPFPGRSSRGRTGTVNRTIHETARYIRRATDGFGHIRARRKLASDPGAWSVRLFGDAIPSAKLYQDQPL